MLKGDAARTVADLKAGGAGEILVQGSSDLIRTLQEAGLIDEYRLLTFPVVLGDGKRLFASGTVPAGLKLTEVTSTAAGVVHSVYERAAVPAYGTVA
ncbi:dihydrofolate reductase family protein [Actinomadura violacea]|uniref:dihydrofolate reductase family protein n=1 Tax=Actinomadura violacea TaxID=2819934 RepID=UPI001E2CC79A|nr:dihydrofolate reductase family protein [Actinomadura violacea]